MSRTFEELVGQELDNLYRGALFLSAGDAVAAEELLVGALSAAFRRHVDGGSRSLPERWLEGWLVRYFVEGFPGGPQAARGGRPVARRPPWNLAEIGPAALFEAAVVIPGWPRAALWLVLLRRWGYQEAATALGIDRETLRDLLRYRDVLLREVMAPRRGNGTHGKPT